MTKIAAIQMASGTNISANLNEVARQISSAVDAGAKLIVLPESFALMGLKDADQLDVSEDEGLGPIQDFLSAQANKNKVWLVAGTIPLNLNSDNPNYQNKIHSACLRTRHGMADISLS